MDQRFSRFDRSPKYLGIDYNKRNYRTNDSEQIVEPEPIVISSEEDSKNIIKKIKIKREHSLEEEIPNKKRKKEFPNENKKEKTQQKKINREFPVKNEKEKDQKKVKQKCSNVKKETPSINACINDQDLPTTETLNNTYQNDKEKILTDSQWLARTNNLDINISEKILYLFENENSIPFIARYRRDLTNGMTAEQLRSLKQSYDTLLSIKKKAISILNVIHSQNKLTKDLKHSILNARTKDELEHLFLPFKPGPKTLLSEKAKKLGLEDVALSILNGSEKCDINQVARCKRLSLKETQEGVTHIISYNIAHDSNNLSVIHDLLSTLDNCTFIETKQLKKKTVKSESKNSKSNDSHKFENYFNFRIKLAFLKPHQVLAINRGESKKILSVKFVLPNHAFLTFKNFCYSKWYSSGVKNHVRSRIFEESVKDAYSRFIAPLITRQIRASLRDKAEKASVEVFANNLKNMLLAYPYKGRKILGIDPGFKNGSKLALISETGEIIDTGVIYPLSVSKNNNTDASFLKQMLEKNNCYTIALGNGTACREMEKWLTELNEKHFFKHIIQYTIVDECGVSIYSCSSEAKQEFRDVDPFIISAASLARRLQDPLAELVKVEPKHLGVGMYQHDIKEKILNESLNEVISECVSFVGIDLNTASPFLLRKIAGLNERRASSIIQHRRKIGFFKHRSELKDVKGIGDKTFEQCAGFLRVGFCTTSMNEASFYKISGSTPLDRTWIHPESYEAAERLIHLSKLSIYDLGKPDFIKKLQQFLTNSNIKSLMQSLNVTENVFQLITEGLLKPLDYDMRSKSNQEPLFRKGITRMSDLKIGSEVTGRVQNVTHFGSFVDIGVEQSGLIHVSQSMNISLRLGDKVVVEVLNFDIKKGTISLKLKTVLNQCLFDQ